MTQEIRETTKNINVEADNILESKDLELDKDSARNIKGETSKFTTMTNDILDVSTIDSSNIKIYNTKYNIKNIIKYLVITYQDICLNKGIEFRFNIGRSDEIHEPHYRSNTITIDIKTES